MNHRAALRNHVERGLALIQAGRMNEAAREVQSAVRLDPDAVESLGLRGMVALANRQHEEADLLLARAFDRDARNVHWAVALGRARYRLQRWDAAETALRAAVLADPSRSDAWVLLGLVLRRSGRASDAAAALERAVAIDPRSDAALINLGNVYRDLGLHERAGSCYRAACAAVPGSAAAHYHLGVWLRDQDDDPAAVRAFEATLERDPSSVEARFNLAGSLCTLNRIDDATFQIQQAVSSRPSDVALLLRGGALLAEHDRVEEARALIERARLHAPDDPAVLNNLGMLLHRAGQLDAAVAAYDQALAFEPHGAARLNRSLALLSVGRWGEGWEDYAARWRDPTLLERLRIAMDCERWNGGDLAGKCLLVLGEQGLGDEIMFASIVHEMVVAAQRVILQCSVRLESLFRRSLPDVVIIATDRMGADWPERVAGYALAFGPVDAMTTVGDLARYRRRDLSAFSTRAGYLKCDPIRRAAWRERLAALGEGPVLGLSWRGGTNATGRHRRSLALDTLSPLLDRTGVHFVSLQYGACVDEILELARKHGLIVHYFPEAIEDYDETAALVGALDGVVSVCTAVVHLAGALGQTVHVLAPKVPEWRYGLSGPRMPWYASAVVHRQDHAGDWRAVIAEVARILPGRVGAGSTAGDARDEAGRYADEAFRDAEWARAESAYAEVLVYRPDDPVARSNRGTSLLQLGRLDEAIDEFRRALAAAPDSDALHANLGAALYDSGDYVPAAHHLSRAVALNPDAAKHRYNLAAALQACDRLDEARTHYEQAIELESDFADAYNALGVLLYRERRVPEAQARFDRALALDPCNPDYRLNRAYLLLLDGRWDEGWREHEWRLLCRAGESGRGLSGGLPRIEPGVTVRLVAEQGYGDCIQFVRYATRLASAGMTVVLQTYPALLQLFRSVRGVSAVVDPQNPPACERVYSLMSLPALFGTSPQDVHDTPYLAVPAPAVERWRARVGALKGLKVGLVWAGSSGRDYAEAARVDRRRSIPFMALAPLARLDVTFVSLQVGSQAIQHNPDTASATLDLVDWTRDIQDFAETAALVTHLDLVISVDTAVAHLAGALGRRVWMLSRFDGCWRWLLDGERTSWYPSMRIYRQPSPGNWATVVERVARDLTALATGSSSG